MNLRINKLGGAIATAIVSLAMTACGGGPDIDKVKADFDNPSGSTQNESAVMAANGKREASGPALALGASGVPGASLTAQGKFNGLSQIGPMNVWGERARTLAYYAQTGHQRQLKQAQIADPGGQCANSPEAQAAYDELMRDLIGDVAFGGTSAEGSASYTQDLSSCSGGAMTGTMEVTVELKMEGSAQAWSFQFTVEQSLDNVCEAEGEKACVSGDVLMEASMEGNATGEGAGSMVFTVAYDLSATWTEGGQSKSASVKGGIRTSLVGDGVSGQVKIEFLFYVTTPEGDDYSYVMTIEAQTDGSTTTLDIRGKDGELSCTILDDGSGSCTGAYNHEWTAAEFVGLGDDWYED